ncbi:YbfB/YjiJ family MFS transporter [Vibrio sp. SCSIO 43137]|uniref:YbfB/YjiJ family MFS transporter n=1 Tax=Vibrio sp. SCSIO 43137 TaxID=3021011 RepID=UPI002306F089|nr:YbfB/YjiJ family MFS transporter [Vibrio sp. SCSIO 43137]WCE32101.1 YbfB/YjiJ family MFS transporter [Vibrio sp. SCSIO 43137]
MIKKDDIPLLFLGITTTFVGLGIGRFSFTAMLPEMILSGWFSDSDATYIGTANLLGYLAGALLTNRILRFLSVGKILSLSVFAISLSYLLCALPGYFGWFAFWRFVAGISGAFLIIVGPSTVLSFLPKERQAFSGNLLFVGLGLGILLSTSVSYLSYRLGFSSVWLLLGFVAVILLFPVRSVVSRYNLLTTKATPVNQSAGIALFANKALLFVLLAYALQAMGYVPHTVFWVDYLARELELGTTAASVQWMVFGFGAIFGPVILGVITHHLGWSYSLILAFALNTVAIATPLFCQTTAGYLFSSFFVGAMLPCIVALVSGSIYQLVGADLHKQYWGLATLIFAALQAFSGYSMSLLYNYYSGYHNLFAVASVCLLAGTAFTISSVLVRNRQL